MDEFAMGSSTEHSAYQITKNPLDHERIPGGSGGGSAAAVAANFAPIAIGTDTGGSIRQPASVTGTVGAKPTYGAVSRYGLIAMSSSLDQAGPCSTDVLSSAMLQELISGYDPKDSTSSKKPALSSYDSLVDAVAKAKSDLESGDLKSKKLRVGIISELNGGEGFEPEVAANFKKTCDDLKAAGIELELVDCPSFKYALAAYYIIMPSEVSSNLAKFDGMRFGVRVDADHVTDMMKATREYGFGDEVKRRIILGTYALSAGYYDAYYGTAQKVRTMIQRDLNDAFSKFDVLLSPTSPNVAFKFGSKTEDPLAMYMNDIATIPVNLAGIPAMSVPNGTGEAGLPTGVQVWANQFEDDKMYYFAELLELLNSSAN
jgi:aspartyl-tRNA(Asn)/glutamyl-tRNA(Gln) amidotransferase subunit A